MKIRVQLKRNNIYSTGFPFVSFCTVESRESRVIYDRATK